MDAEPTFKPDRALAMPPGLRELQSKGPVHRIRTQAGDGAWLVTGYDEVRELLSDERLGSSHPDPDNAPRLMASAMFGGPMGEFDTEKADHERMRSLLQPYFSPGHMNPLRTHVEALTDEYLGELEQAGPPADLHKLLAVPLPILVICELLGVPYEDRDEFCQWTHAASDLDDEARSGRGMGSLYQYGARLVARKREEPGADFISYMLEQGDVPDEEIAALAMTLLLVGYQTVVMAIGLGVTCLLSTPGQWQALRDDPDRIPAAVEEILRAADKGGAGISRYAREALEVAGTTIGAGELVVLDQGAANQDPAVFADPDRFDSDRDEGYHLAFGHGASYCIGAPLARIELQVVFARLVERFPGMRLAAPLESLQRDTRIIARPLLELPVEW